MSADSGHPQLVDLCLHTDRHSLVGLVLVAFKAVPPVGRDLDLNIAALLVADLLIVLVDGDDAHSVRRA